MAMKTGKCPVCGQLTPYPDDKDDFFCLSCGAELHVNRARPAQHSERPAESSAPAMKRFDFIDPQTKLPLASAEMPETFRAQGAIIANFVDSALPLKIHCAAFDAMGTVMSFFTGEGFMDSSHFPMANGPYAAPANAVNRVKYRNFMDAASYVDSYMNNYARNSKASALRFIEERPLPIDGFSADRVLELMRFALERDRQAAGDAAGAVELGYYIKPVCRVYEMTVEGKPFMIALAALVTGAKVQVVMPAMPMMPNLLGGLFGMNRQQPKSAFAPSTAYTDRPDFAAMPNNAFIEWKSDGVFMLQCMPQAFDAMFKTLFRQFCSGFRVSREVEQEADRMRDRIRMDIAAATRQNIQQMNANFAAWQRANASRQAAFDAANKAWWDRSNAAHAAARASGMSGESSADRMSRLRSEAIRGVNTYTDEYGNEREVSVSYDRAYSNGLGDTLGSNSAFEPGGNWTEMNRKN